MTISGFQFSNPVLTKVIFLLNDKVLENKMPSNADIPIKTTASMKQMGEHASVVALKVDVGEQSDHHPFYISAIMQAKFIWNDSISDDMAEVLLKRNAPALLLGYIRPYIAQITEASPIGTVHLPFMNFAEECEE